jgi:hypothetical protein
VQFPSSIRFRILVQEFQTPHIIPHIIGIMDGPHVPVLPHLIKYKHKYENLLLKATKIHKALAKSL